jgi:hypothetical protein
LILMLLFDFPRGRPKPTSKAADKSVRATRETELF